LPSLHGGIEAMNPFTGEVGTWDYLIAFDIEYPEVDLFGGSLDFDIDAIETVVRVEATYTTGEEFSNTLDPQLYSESDMFRWVLGLDRNTFIPFLNKNRAFLFSAQVFGEHMLDYELERGPLGAGAWSAGQRGYSQLGGQLYDDSPDQGVVQVRHYQPPDHHCMGSSGKGRRIRTFC